MKASTDEVMFNVETLKNVALTSGDSAHHRAAKVYFELTNRCNFKCDFCPIEYSRRSKRNMDFSLFQKGIQDIVKDDVTGTVGFHVLGEPLIHPRFIDAIRYAKNRGLRTEVNTNGSLLTREMVGKIIASKLDKLVISVETIDEGEHACRGSRIPFQTYYGRIVDTLRLIKNSDAEIDIELCLMNTQMKKHFSIDRLIRLNGEGDVFKQMLCHFISEISSSIGKPVSTVDIQAGLRHANLNRPGIVNIDERIKAHIQRITDWGNAFTTKRVHAAKIGYCGLALNNIGILSNGEVTICSMDYDGNASLGNLGIDSLGSILSSSKAMAIREGFQSNRVVHPVCRRCIGSSRRIKTLLKGIFSIYSFRWKKLRPAMAC
jgi:MoaA/NifB/PqqE/SkfB family radical SAM enzyme